MNARTKTTLITSLVISMAAMGLSACGPARHTTTMSDDIVDGLTMFADPSDDFEFPDVDEDDGNVGQLDGETPGETITHTSPEGRKPAAWDGNTPEAAKFTELTEKALDSLGSQILETVPDDIEDFCPNYPALDREARKGVWLMIISGIAKFESGFRNSVWLQEKFKNAKNEFVVSRGLLQISSESANGFGCRIQKEADLHDPAINLACGVRILTKTVTKDTMITAHDERWHGGARYWSVLRKPKTLIPIKNVTRALASCKAS